MLKLFTSLLFTLLISTTSFCQQKPNVIYILADDLGYGDLSCYGQTKISTPNIDRLASEGIKFINHYSGNTVCSPSRASLMTGQHSGHVHCRGNVPGENNVALDPEMTTLPEIFKNAGYATGGFGKWGLGITSSSGNASPLAHGFDEFYGWKSQSIAHTYYPQYFVANGVEIPLEPGTFIHDKIIERALGFIERNASQEKPFFCYIPTAVPHAAMHAPKELHEKWRLKFPQFDSVIGEYGAGKEDDCPPVRNPIAGFAAMMENLDNEVGRIMTTVKAMGIEDNTLIIFTSDNGAHHEGGHDPEFWNSTGNLRGIKRDLYEGGIRTPMLARWPAKIQAGSTSEHISAFWDVMPTMAAITNQATPSQSDGISFLPTLLGNKTQKQHEYLYWEFCKGAKQDIFSQAVRKGNWKAFQLKGGEMELYDLAKDPYEKTNLASKNPEIVKQMTGVMKEAHVDLK
ncbi:Arylsulfatase A [Spirosomataceae bacterium TFI 002]|nr:Arylsulfatase A [Spirosomataceae bacterium TFI 002]